MSQQEEYFAPDGTRMEELTEASAAKELGVASLLCLGSAPFALWLGLRARKNIKKAPGRYHNGRDIAVALTTGTISCMVYVVYVYALAWSLVIRPWLLKLLTPSRHGGVGRTYWE